MFAVLAGARHVYAMEASGIADEAVKIIASNGMSDRITILKGMAEDQELPEQADVLVSEWMGYGLFYEWMLDTVLAVRDRWLRPEGVMMPSEASLYVALYSHEELFEDRVRFWEQRTELLSQLDMSALAPFALECTVAEPMVEHTEPEQILSFAERVATVNLRTCTLAQVHTIHMSCRLRALGSLRLAGVVLWFDVTFPGGLVLTTSPEHKDGYNSHWRQTQLLLDREHPMVQDDVVQVQLTLSKSADDNHRFVDYHLRMVVNDVVALPERHLTLT